MDNNVIDDLKKIFELATNSTILINEILKLKNNKKDFGKNNLIKVSRGYSAQIGSSGDSAQIGSSGDSAQIGSSGYYARIGSSGNYARIGSSGYYAVISAIGFNSIIKAKKDSWITLAEYDKNCRLICVKSAKIDGEILKENTYYCLYNSDFKEVQIIDDCVTIIENKKGNILKGRFLNNKEKCFIFEKDGIYAHGDTARQAYIDWLFKTSDRDVEQYRNIDKNKIKPLDYWIIAYRTITGACSAGTNNYLETNKEKYKKEMTLKEVLKATQGQYGYETFKEFFERN